MKITIVETLHTVNLPQMLIYFDKNDRMNRRFFI